MNCLFPNTFPTMSNCIYKLVQYVNTSLDGFCDKNELDVVCASISVLFTVKKLVKANEAKDLVTFKDEYNKIKEHFSEIVSYYDCFISQLSQEQLSQINHLIDEILVSNSDDTNAVSWIYQQLKYGLAKKALKKIGSEKNKLTGADMLLQTQFFTDEYMVKYLVDKVFEIKKKSLPNVVFIDPACGGGNFLTYVYLKLFEWYKSHTDYDQDTINSLILDNNLIGYDLDYNLSQIAGLSVYTCCRLHTSNTTAFKINIYGGDSDDTKGFLTDSVKSNTISGMGVAQKISSLKKNKVSIIYITNPPFMGKRDMDTKLKEHLQLNYPNSKGDLCYSFMEQILKNMRNQDLFAAVTQNGWLNLSSLKAFRKNILDNYFLHSCIDMGANAFENINGEKTNIVLPIITGKRRQTNQKTLFVNLRNYKLEDKKNLLSAGNYKVYSVDMSNFRKNANYEFCYQLGNDIDKFQTMSFYGKYSKCMQGSSTGDNKTMVKYVWETDEPGWVLASKGGGYSKWEGLNYYKVKWGEKGELLKNNKGSALRNPNEIDETAIVYSDTGTLGLSTRLRLNDQVFIASGPGIKVLKGNPLCHIAFLNSKIATFFLKVLNPKFTVSAGYISKIPVADGILDDEFLKNASGRCIKLKRSYLTHKLPNIEFVHDDYQDILDVDIYINNFIKQDIFNHYCRYLYENAINEHIESKYNLTESQKIEYNHMMGENLVYSKTDLNLKRIDTLLSSTLNECCQTVSRKLNGYIIGTENSIDMISYVYSAPPKLITRFLLENVESLASTKRLYKTDLIHKLILKVSGINCLTHVSICPFISSIEIMNSIKDTYPILFEQLQITQSMIQDVIQNVHKKCFNNKPILLV